MKNQTVSDLIRTAYAVNDNQVTGGPGWIRSTAFDLDARGPADMSADTARAMLRELLADRFSLAVHREQRQLPIYALTLAARDGRPGPQLRPSAAQCAPMTPPKGLPPPPPPPGTMDTVSLMVAPTLRRCPSMFMTGHVSARAVSLDVLAMELTQLTGRPVVNRTGLSGEFDIDLSYAPDLNAAPPPGTATAPELTTAVREQLGMRLDPGRGPVEVLVIDRVMMATDN
jgi:uncharacterized protein (TIGR03435 family)